MSLVVSPGRQRILVVEDEPILRGLIAELLTRENREVVEAGDGKMAWELCQSELFDAVISDISMPGFDGFELLRRVRKLHSTLPFLFITAHDTEKNQQEAQILGSSGIVPKPFRREELLQLVERILNRAKAQIDPVRPFQLHLPAQLGLRLLVGAPAKEIELEPLAANALRSALLSSGPGAWPYLLEYRAEDGTARFAELVGTKLLRGERGLEAEGILLDRTEAEQTLRELRRERGVLHDVLSNIPHSVFWKDRNSVYLGANESFLRDAGVASASELIGKTDLEMPWGKTEAEAYRRDDANLMASGRPRLNIEETQASPGQPLRHLVTSKVPLKDAEQRVTGILGIYMDITELRQAQGQIMAQEARLHGVAKMAALGEMAAGIAHEINNPLAIIHALAGELADAETIRPERLKYSLNAIEKTAERIAKIVSGLRSFSRNETGNDFKPAALEEILSETLEFCRDRLNHAGIEITLPDPAGRTLVNCRRTEISQVLLNLLNNAVDAVAALPERWIRVELSRAPGQVLVSVTDAGAGIPEAVRAKMLDPFFTTKEIGKGTGLGLSISHGIAQAHGGELRYNEASPRTQFILKLPG